MVLAINDLYEFDGYVVDGRTRRLMRAGEPVTLTPKAFETLLVLVANHGRVLEKDELLSAVWPDTTVEESALSRNIYLLRKALGESPDDHRYIVTVPGRGYRFVGIVTHPSDPPAALDWGQSAGGPGAPATEVVVATRSIATIETDEPDALAPGAIFSPWRQRVLVIAVVGVTAALAASVVVWRSATPVMAPRDVRSLAVLPFRPLVASARDEYLGLGLADVLITRLHHLREIAVRPTSAIREYADRAQDAVSIGTALHVDAVLEGTIQRDGDRVRVTARLIAVRGSRPLWSEQFDVALTDLFAIEDRISTQLVGALALELTRDERQRFTRRRPTNSEAYQAYLRGRYYWSRWSRASLEKAIASFEEALAADRSFAPALSGLADSYTLLGYLGLMSPHDAFPKSKAAALAALALDESLGEAHASLGKSLLFYEWDWTGAERELTRAIALDPSNADAHAMYGTYLTAAGRFDEALAERLRALELDPATPLNMTMVGWVHYYAGRYDRAVEAYRKALDLDPNFAQPHTDLANAFYAQAKYDEAIAEFIHVRGLAPGAADDVAALKDAYRTGGRTGFWTQQLAIWDRRRQEGRPVGPWVVARAYAEIGNRDRAFEWLEKALDDRSSLLVFLDVAPMFASIKDDPRFADLVRRIGIPPRPRKRPD